MLEGFILDGVPVWLFWALVGPAVIIQGISKSGFAGGAGILSLPLMMLVMPVDKVSACLLPLLCLFDLNAIYHHPRNKDWSKIIPLFIPAVFGTLLGTLVWWWVGEKGINHYGGYIKQFTGIIAILFSFYIVAKETALHWVEGHTPGPVTTWLAGLSAGFCSTIVHAAGPIVGLYLFSFNLGKSLFVGTTAWTFALINITKLPFYFAVGLITPAVLQFDLLLVWMIPIGSYLGKWMYSRVPEKPFNWTIMVLTLISGIQLLFKVDLIRGLLEWFW